MVQPFDYSIRSTAQGPLQALSQGMQLGQQFAQIAEAREAAKLKDQERQLAIEQQTRMNTALSNFRTKFGSGTLNSEDVANVVLANPGLKSLGDNMRTVFDMFSADRQNNEKKFIGQTYAALRANPQQAAAMLQERAEASRESDPGSARFYEMLAKVAPVNATLAAEALLPLGNTIFGKEWTEGLLSARKAPVELSKLESEAVMSKARTQFADVIAQGEALKAINEARKVGLDADLLVTQIAEAKRKLQGGPELESDARKIVNDSVLASMKSTSLASQYDSLANAISSEMSSGIVARGQEAVRRFFGTEDQITALRQEYRRLRNSQVIQNLPPGAASDKDIQIALEAFPPETADPNLIASFLRGVAKMQRYDAALSSAQAEWTAQNGSLGRSRREITVAGQTIPAGTNFTDALGRLIAVPTVIGSSAPVAAPPPPLPGGRAFTGTAPVGSAGAPVLTSPPTAAPRVPAPAPAAPSAATPAPAPAQRQAPPNVGVIAPEAGTTRFQVTAPNGATYYFPTRAAAEEFKRRGGF